MAHPAQDAGAAEGDEEREVFAVPAFIRTMVEKKLLGDKTKGGFYKKEGKDILTFDPTKLEYRAKGGNPDIAKATVYTTLASARGQDKVLRWYGLGPAPKVEIVALEATVKGVIE